MLSTLTRELELCCHVESRAETCQPQKRSRSEWRKAAIEKRPEALSLLLPAPLPPQGWEQRWLQWKQPIRCHPQQPWQSAQSGKMLVWALAVVFLTMEAEVVASCLQVKPRWWPLRYQCLPRCLRPLHQTLPLELETQVRLHC